MLVLESLEKAEAEVVDELLGETEWTRVPLPHHVPFPRPPPQRTQPPWHAVGATWSGAPAPLGEPFCELPCRKGARRSPLGQPPSLLLPDAGSAVGRHHGEDGRGGPRTPPLCLPLLRFLST